jgi:hypothetical protein
LGTELLQARAAGDLSVLAQADLLLLDDVDGLRAGSTRALERVFRERAEADGRHTKLQSINSEDAVTWAAFGPRAPSRAVPSMLDLAFRRANRPLEWNHPFWKRWPHPDTHAVEGGPEPDVTFTGMVLRTGGEMAGRP